LCCHLNENSTESKSYMYSDTLFLNNINALFTMKILKFFIILFGLITLICNNTNAQEPNGRAPIEVVPIPPEWPDIPYIELEEPDVSMDVIFPNGGAVADEDPSTGPPATMRLAMVPTEVHVTATIPTILALRIYDSLGTIKSEYTSEPSTDSYTFTIIIGGNPNDELYIECGYYGLDDLYRADSGCTVTIEPQ